MMRSKKTNSQFKCCSILNQDNEGPDGVSLHQNRTIPMVAAHTVLFMSACALTKKTPEGVWVHEYPRQSFNFQNEKILLNQVLK